MRYPIFACVLVVACGSPAPEERTAPAATAPASSGAEAELSIDQRLQMGVALLQRGKCDRAIAEGFQPAIEAFEREYAGDQQVIASRASGSGVLMALLTAASEQRNAVVVGPDYPDTLYMRAFCEIELRDLGRAETTLRKALAIMPDDVVYSCELGHVLQQRNAQAEAIQVYRAALANADMLDRSGAFAPTPDYPAGVPVFNGHTIDDWRRRALRGIGYSQFELGDFQAAEQSYLQVLQIDPNDEQAQRELQLIHQRLQNTI